MAVRMEAAMGAVPLAVSVVVVVAGTARERAEVGGWEEVEERVGGQEVEADQEVVAVAMGPTRQPWCCSLWISRPLSCPSAH
ncbi:hypothetical protein AB1Y20_012446 [Prymnesium parvum]|uniref:Secreted protein n=1 Tax=Prymnesium parvum TaxID=97485 RepID=A0AB34IHY3_PRYPA|mmetsp:Transcript_48426/g.120019  ORF Transcript_48426/g.120019 Transcript_48426/m.120019 type:complete len:82 (+) Transcript_48426:901-1146(+)